MRESTKATWIREKLMGKRILALYQSIATLSCAVGAVKCIERDEDEEGLCRNVNRSVDNNALNYRVNAMRFSDLDTELWLVSALVIGFDRFRPGALQD